MMQSIDVPDVRIRAANEAPVHAERDFVLYWMSAHRRLDWNFSLDRACELCRELGRPLLILEAVRVGYRWASLRFHRFMIDGMEEHRQVLDGVGVTYFPYVEPSAGDGSGLIEALAEHACVVVTDDFPCFFLPRMVAAAAEQLDVRLEAVDSNGLYPMRATERVFSRAVDLRRHLQRHLAERLFEMPQPQPFESGEGLRGAEIPPGVLRRWKPFELGRTKTPLDQLPIDSTVPEAELRGGPKAARKCLAEFLDARLERYGEGRNQPEDPVTSQLSPYLHFGHISAHEVFYELSQKEDWNPTQLADFSTGKREGWWGMSANAESFLDELVTWRELGLNLCSHRADYDQYESLPDWVRQTLLEHSADERPYVYDLETFETAATHDELWNAAQNELRHRGIMHNYLRMLWGKKILHWTASPRDALAVMIELNNKYALDGRDPNSYSGIFWVLGRYDRAWGPERPVFGKIRYMTSASTKRKLRVGAYIERWSTLGSPSEGQ